MKWLATKLVTVVMVIIMTITISITITMVITITTITIIVMILGQFYIAKQSTLNSIFELAVNLASTSGSAKVRREALICLSQLLPHHFELVVDKIVTVIDLFISIAEKDVDETVAFHAIDFFNTLIECETCVCSCFHNFFYQQNCTTK